MGEITEKLIRRAASGDQQAIAQLYELTYSQIYKTVHALIQDEDSVLDIVQDSYIKGFQSLDQLEKPAHYPAWMKRIAINKTKDYLKRKKALLFTELASEDGEEIDFQDERLDHCPEAVIDRQETVRLMKEILGTLSEEQRMVLGMFYYEELSVREIARTLGCSENTVKSRLNYGRKKVEAKVRELEKKGTKLYSLAPLPFLLWLFRMDAQAAEIPSPAVLDSITAACAHPGSAAGTLKSAVSAGGKAGTGVKALTAKILAGVLAIAVVGGGAGAVVSSQKKPEAPAPTEQILTSAPIPEPAVSETEQTTAVPVTEAEAYGPILERYEAVLDADSAAYLAAPETWFNGDHQAVFYYHTYHSDSFYYARRDIDGNGTEELLIGFGTEGYIQIVDLYGFDGVQAVQLMDEPTLGDRSRLTLLDDGTLSLSGSSSWSESSQTYWKIQGSSLVSADPSAGAEAAISWTLLKSPQALSEPSTQTESAGVCFDTILADITYVVENISTEEYQSQPEYYDSLYPHLGSGVLWTLTYGPVNGYQQAVFNTCCDADGDGQQELCIGRGVSLGRPITTVAIYRQNGEVIVGDLLNNYPLPEALDEAGMPLAGWEYLCG